MQKFNFDNAIIYNSVYEYIDSNMYFLIEAEKALIIDPHENEELFELLKKKRIKDITILLTHEHPDHISGIYWLQKHYNATLICTKYCSEYISKEKNVRPILISFILEERDRQNGTNMLEKFNREFVPHTYSADVTFESNYKLIWCKHSLEFYNIVGHSKGSCIIILDKNIVFTGDSLMKDLPVITRFPGGNKKAYILETLPFLQEKLQKDMHIMPGHGEPFELYKIMSDGKLNVTFR